MKKINNIVISVLGISLMVIFFLFAFSNVALANSYQIACPFSPATNRTIVYFSTQFVVGKTALEVTKSVNLPAGDYKVSLQSFDGYNDRVNVSQPNERYFVDFKNGSTVVARSGQTPDLQDNVKNASYSGVVNSSLTLSQNVTSVVARHSNTINPMSTANSVTAGCAAFDRISLPPPPPPTPDLTASCSISPSSVNVGGYLNWSATASGGSGSYNYSWNGTDGLYGNSTSVSKSYSSAGTKTGTVTVTSGSQSVVKTCSANVNEVVDNNLTISCSANPSSVDVDEDITWRSYPAGGTGSYSYDWDGTDSLSGSSRNITWSYDDNGTKRATVTVYSGNQTASASCTVRVDEEYYDDDLSVSCYASPTTTQVGNRMNWYVRVSGGDGDYDYDWEGSDGLNSSSRSPYMTYNTPGTKSAEITVRDGDGNRDSDTCYVNVNSVLAYSQTYQAPLESAVYLSQVPYTGVADNYKLALYLGVLGLFSAWIAYAVISYKKNTGEIN